MKEQFMTSVVSALVGGAVAAIAIFSTGNGTGKMDSLEVGSLKVTKELNVQMAETENPLLMIKDGGTITSGSFIANHVMANQISGSVLVANRMFTTPDNLAQTPMNQWRFFTELGASPQAGGELIVRSPNGAFVAGSPGVEQGQFVRVGFNMNDLVEVIAANNATKAIAPIAVQAPPNTDASTAPTTETPQTANTGAGTTTR